MTRYALFEIGISVASAVILFMYALKGFSDDIRRKGGVALERMLSRITSGKIGGFVFGAIATALVQSSSAITGITVALVEAGTITFRGSLPVFLGANVGTTTTAWIVAFDAEILGPILVVLSAILTLLPGRLSLFGRSIFYLGVVLLALQLVSDQVGQLKESSEAAQWLKYASHPFVGLMIGAIATALLQSSSVVVGLGVIAVQQGLLSPQDVIPIVFGANIGTTSTSLIASMGMGIVARRAAIANLVFNILGVAIFFPFVDVFSSFVMTVVDGDLAVAFAHLIFNLGPRLQASPSCVH